MKYVKKYLFILISVILSTKLFAYNRGDKHNVILSVAGGYTGYIHDYAHINALHSSNWELFLGYEYERSHFIVQSGLGLRYNVANAMMDNYQTSLFTYDTQGKMFEYVYDFTIRQDEATAYSLNVPLLLGGKFSCVYFLAGIINNILVWEDYSINSLLTCTGYYDRYIGDFIGMDNHAFYKNEPLSRSSDYSSIHPVYQLYPYLEIGVDVANLPTKHRYYGRSNDFQVRLAAFTQVGALNAYSHTSEALPYVVDKNYPYDLSKIEIPAICNTQHVAQSYLYDWTVGLRLSLIFDVSRSSRFCITCDYR